MHFYERDIPEKSLKKHTRWKISSSCTNQTKKNPIHFCTLGLLVWKWVELQYQPLFSAKDDCVKNSEGSVNYNWSYCTETILSTDEWWWQHNNIIQQQNFVVI
jgi:hypothetical protein